jgi:hypothetical protein
MPRLRNEPTILPSKNGFTAFNAFEEYGRTSLGELGADLGHLPDDLELMRSLLEDRSSVDLTHHTSTAYGDAGMEFEEEHESNMPVATRSLRKRNAGPTNPYKFDKIKHELTKSMGIDPKDDQVEEALQQEIDGTQSHSGAKRSQNSGGSTAKKAKGSQPKKTTTRARLSSETSCTIFSTEADFARTILHVWLDGFSAGAATVTLDACDNVEKLMDFIAESWEWQYCGGEFHYAVASFSWLDGDSNIILRQNSSQSFKGITHIVENAPIWSKDGGKATCDVKIMVYLQ